MKRFIAVVSCMFVSLSVSVEAQTVDTSFCAAAPDQMLIALEGDWKLHPGAGVAMAANMVIPMPPQAAQPLTFTYDPSTISISIKDVSTGQSFIMIPTTVAQAEMAVGITKDWSTSDFMKIGTGCDWYALPAMIVTSVYVLDKTPAAPKNMINGSVSGVGFSYCFYGKEEGTVTPADLHAKSPNVASVSSGGFTAAYIPFFKESPSGASSLANPDCKPPETMPSPAKGDLVMNLVAKFQTPDSGTGVLYFEGEMNGHRAVAVRPVTLSR